MHEEDDRLKKEIGAGRRSRASEDRTVTEDRVRTDDDRLAMFRQQMFNDALPDLPPIPGYHVCWLTTTNPRDSIHRRMMLGYTPVTLEDAPGLDHSTLKTGEYAGLLGINEMIAFKLPMHLYEAFMQEAHHIKPAQEAERLNYEAQSLLEQGKRSGLQIEMEEGMAEIGSNEPARGIFS
jgi:hypothetical protein